VAHRILARIRSVNDARSPAIITTDNGTFQMQRRMPKVAYRQLLRKANDVAGTGELCALRYVPQKAQSGSRHTLLDIAILG